MIGAPSATPASPAELLQQGLAHSAAGRARSAARSLRAAARGAERGAGGQRDAPGGDLGRVRVRAHLALAAPEFELQGLRAALQSLDRALEGATDLDDPELVALCRSQRGMLIARSGDLAGGREHLQAALAGVDALQPRDQAVLLLNFGTLLMLDGDLAHAVTTLGRSADVALAADLHREAFMARSNQGYAAYLTGDLPRALSLLSAAEALDADASESIVRLDRGRVLVEAGLLTEARDVLVEAATIGGVELQRHTLAEIELELARVALLLGRTDEARERARAARRRFRRRDAAVWAARAELVLGQLDLSDGRAPGRVLRTARALTDQLADGDMVLRAEHALLAASAAWAAGQQDEASDYLQQGEAAADLLPLRARMEAAGLRARLAVTDGRPDRARRVLSAAARRLSLEQATSASTDLRSALTLHAVDLARLHAELTIPHGPAAVFGATERWRATSSRLRPALAPEDPELASLLVSLREVRDQLRDAPPVVPREPMLRREESLRRQVRDRSWAWGHRDGSPSADTGATDERASGQGVSYRATRRALEADGADLACYFVHDRRVHAVSVVGGRGRVVDLAPAEQVEALVRRARADLDVAARGDLGPFAAAVWGSLRAGMTQLDDLLLRPLGVGGRRLVLVPHAGAAALPWALAPRLHGVPHVVASSATDWTRRRAFASSRQGRPPAVRALSGPELRQAEREAALVADTWRAVPAEDHRGTVSGLREALLEADVVHVAAHGTHQQQNPMFASVLLHDGPLYVYDLQHTGVGAAHVVLGACEVGRSTVRPGEEALGLTAGLLGLGAQCVVAAMGQLPDEVSLATMGRYHAALRQGRASDEAMAEAVEGTDPLAAAFQVAGASWRAP